VTRARPVLAGLLLSGLLWGCGSSPGPRSLPNVLLITLDTTRADRLGCYGYELDTTPRMDALAEQGVLFERAIAQASVTPVSHAAIFTGLYPYKNGLRLMHGNIGHRMHPGVPTLASHLESIGYRTAAFIGALPCSTRFGLDLGFEHFDDPFTGGDHAGASVDSQGIVSTGKAQRTARATNERIFEWLEGTDTSSALFLWAHYFDPHDPHVVPEDPEALRRFPPRGASRRDRLLRLYDQEVRYMDEHAGGLVDRFRTFDRPLVVAIVGDHGEGLGDHDWWSHGILYQEQLRVPMILSGEGIPAGVRVPSLVRTVDLAPTLLGVIGEDPRRAFEELDGVDLGPLVRGETGDLGLDAYAESVAVGMRYLHRPQNRRQRKPDELYTLVEGRFKYIFHRREPEASELYDLDSDPGEQHDLRAREPELAARFERELRERGVFFDPRTATRGPAAREPVEQRLERLGYLPSDQE